MYLLFQLLFFSQMLKMTITLLCEHIVGNFRGVTLQTLYGFNFHGCTQLCQMYKHAYFTGLFFTISRSTMKTTKNWSPLKKSLLYGMSFLRICEQALLLSAQFYLALLRCYLLFQLIQFFLMFPFLKYMTLYERQNPSLAQSNILLIIIEIYVIGNTTS